MIGFVCWLRRVCVWLDERDATSGLPFDGRSVPLPVVVWRSSADPATADCGRHTRTCSDDQGTNQ